MTDDFVKQLREKAFRAESCEMLEMAADRIEKLVEENGVLFAANVRLSSRADIDSDGYVDRVEKLEAALRSIIVHCEVPAPPNAEALKMFARKALEGKDDVD